MGQILQERGEKCTCPEEKGAVRLLVECGTLERSAKRAALEGEVGVARRKKIYRKKVVAEGEEFVQLLKKQLHCWGGWGGAVGQAQGVSWGR